MLHAIINANTFFIEFFTAIPSFRKIYRALKVTKLITEISILFFNTVVTEGSSKNSFNIFLVCPFYVLIHFSVFNVLNT